jgi:hypothetical protein
MMMQWFVNEVREKFRDLEGKIKEVLDRPVIQDNDARIAKLEGELRALKARMGKNQQQ